MSNYHGCKWEAIKTDFQKNLPGVLSGELGYEQTFIDSMHFLGMWTP